jgi:hypothetical protein
VNGLGELELRSDGHGDVNAGHSGAVAVLGGDLGGDARGRSGGLDVDVDDGVNGNTGGEGAREAKVGAHVLLDRVHNKGSQLDVESKGGTVGHFDRGGGGDLDGQGGSGDDGRLREVDGGDAEVVGFARALRGRGVSKCGY